MTDRGPDIKETLSGYNRHFCFSHMLNNIVKHSSEPDIDKLTSSISKIVKYMKVTGLNTKLSVCLVSYVSTRWNTRFDMFDTFLKCYPEIGDLMKKPVIRTKYEAIDIAELKEVTKYLGLYKILTDETEGEKTVDCVKILPLYGKSKKTQYHQCH